MRMPQKNKRALSGNRKKTAAKRRRKRRVNVPAFVGLIAVLVVLIIIGIWLSVSRGNEAEQGTDSAAASTSSPSETTTTEQEGMTVEHLTTTTTEAARTSTQKQGTVTTATTVSATTAPATTTTTSCTTTVTTQTAPESEIVPTYIQGILVVNKTYALPPTYAPGDLDPTVKAQFDVMQKAAAAEGLNLYISSGYRSYDYQKRIYNNNVAAYGVKKTDTFSARPGHSEHQTGLAFDLNTINDAFALTPESDWVKVHAHEYGFIVRYPEGKSDITGYKYEPWHLRYLGVETATAVYNSGLTLEEYLGIDSVYAD